MLRRSTYTFQRTTNFSWNFVCTRVLHFWQLCQKFWAENERNSISNIKSDEKNSIEFLEKYQNSALELEIAVMSTVCNQGCPESKCFPLQVPKHMKDYVFWTSSFLFKLILCKIKSSFGNFAKNFTPNVQQILAQISKRINSIDCWQKSKKSSTDSECSVDISAEKLSSKVKFFSTLSPKITQKSCFCDSLEFFSKWSSVQVECTSDEHAELFHQKSNIFLCKVQLLWKISYTFQRQPIFHQTLSER